MKEKLLRRSITSNSNFLIFFATLITTLCLISFAQREVYAQGINSDGPASTGVLSSANTSLTFSHTVGSSSTNRLLIVGVSIRNNGSSTPTVSSITYAGTNLTYVGREQRGSECSSEIWRLVAPATGPNNVVVTVSSSTIFGAGAISFTGAHQTTPVGTFFGNQGNSTSLSVNVTSVNEGEVVIDTIASRNRSDPLTVGSGQTSQWSTITGSGTADDNTHVSGSTEPGPDGGGTVTMSWTFGDKPRNWTIGAVAIKPANPTAVKLISFTATEYPESVLLRWKTGYEVDNLGFHLYREENGEFIRLTPDLVAGTALLAGPKTSLGSGHSYHWWDTSLSTQSSSLSPVVYWLEDVDLNGKRTWHGPVVPVFSHEPLPKPVKPEFLNELGMRLEKKYDQYWRVQELLEKLKTKNVNRYTLLGQTKKSKTNNDSQITNNKAAPQSLSSSQSSSHITQSLPSPQSSSLVTQSSLAPQPAVKLSVREQGWYRVTQPELIAAGLNPKVNPRYLQLYADGREQPIRVVGEKDGRFDHGDAIEFYGIGVDTPSTDTRIYWLISGSRFGKRIQTYQGKGGSLGTSSFPYTVEKRDRTIYFAALKNGEASNFFGSIVAGSPVNQLLNVSHPDPASSGDAILEVALQGVTNNSHRVKVFLNEVELGVVIFEGQSLGIGQWSIPQSLLLEGENLVTLVPSAGESDVSLVDVIRLTYWHTYTADDNSLRFTAQGGTQVGIDGFSYPNIRVFDITNPDTALEVLGLISTQGAGYAIKLRVPGSGQKTLLALAEERVKPPETVAANQPSSWSQSQGGYDLVIISHKDFLSSLQPLQAWRESQGLRVALIDVEDLYDEFSFGSKDPKAIKDFLTLAKASWSRPPRYVLLVGDATFDARNFLGMGSMDFMPTKLIDTGYFETASDDWFVDLNDDGLPDLAIGRLPVRTVEEADIVVSKIINYDRVAQVQEAVLVADLNDTFGFEGASEELRGLLPSSIAVRKIFRGDFGTDAATRDTLIQSINQGALLVNYYGHGSVEIWRGGILRWGDAETLSNGWRLPFFINMTCFTGMFHDVYTESLSEGLLKADGGGAIAVWASSGMTEPEGQVLMNRAFVRVLFNGEPITIGEAVRRAKAATGDSDVRRTWILFGDPTSMLKN